MVKGTVKNEQQQPIPGIWLELAFVQENQLEEPHFSQWQWPTDPSGNYEFAVEPSRYMQSLNLLFTDKDGPDNGGEYLPTMVTIPAGEFEDLEQVVDVIMKPKAP